MADRIDAKFMSYDDWKALGPLFQAPEADGDHIYDGTTRDRPETPNWASLSLGGPNKIIGNPNHSSRNDAFTNAHSQWMHIMKVFDEGGEDAFKLIHETAKSAHKITEIAERKHGYADAWVALASDEKTAEVLRGLVTSVLQYYPGAKGVLPATLPKRADELPLEKLKADMKSFEPKRFRRRILENGQVRFAQPDNREAQNDREFQEATPSRVAPQANSRPRQFAGTIAIFADDGMEAFAAKYAHSLDDRLLACPEKKKPLWDELAVNRPKGVFYPRDYDNNLPQGQAAKQLLGRTDAAAFFINGDITSRVSGILAEASRFGKAVKVFGPDGKEMPLMATAREAEASHMSRKEYAQSFSSPAFDLPINDPMAFMGLSMVKSDKLGQINPKDLARLSEMTDSVNDIADMASNGNGQAFLRDQMKITPATIKLLADGDAMKGARESLLKVRSEIADAGMEVIGPADYPEALLASGAFEPYLLVEGNKDLLRNADTIVGISGAVASDERAQRLTSSTNSRAVSALTMQPVTSAYVLGQTSVDIPETGPQLVISTTGKSHLRKEDAEKLERIVENGGCVIHMLPPTNRSWYYDSTAFDPKTKKKGMTVPVPATGDQSTDRRAAKLLAAMSKTVLVTALNARETETPQHVVVTQALKAGRLPTVVNFNDMNLDHVSGNGELLTKSGIAALAGAGIGARDAEPLGKKYAEQRPSIDTNRNMDLAMANLARHLKGQEIQLPEVKRARRAEKVAPEL